MLFQVLNSAGAVVMTTTHTSCIPDTTVLKDMGSAGYKFKIDGKSASVTKVVELADTKSATTKAKTNKLF